MWPNLISSEEREKVILYCLECYGVEAKAWSNFDLYKRKEGLWLTPKGFKESWSCLHEDGEGHPPEGFGLRVLSGKGFPYKITAAFYQAFKEHITKRLIVLTEKQALATIHRKQIDDLDQGELDYGYYIGIYEGRYMGIILLGREGWTSQVPKSFSSQMSKSLELSNK